MSGPRRSALVLDSGGVLGAAWLLGALQAIWAETGWHPAEADVPVGTSAGALVGSLVAARRWPRSDPLSEAAQSALRRASALVPQRRRPWLGPGSLRLAARGWRGLRPALISAGMLPAGYFSTAPLQDFVTDVLPDGWPARPDLRIGASDFETGARRVFDRGAGCGVPVAVAASCAVPGFYHPVAIGGRRYVDGAVSGPSGLPVVRGLDVEAVLCLNPGSAALRGRGLLARRRRALHDFLMREAVALERDGLLVRLVEPSEEVSRMIGLLPMSPRRATAVGRAAHRSVSDWLSSPAGAGCRSLLAELGERTPG